VRIRRKRPRDAGRTAAPSSDLVMNRIDSGDGSKCARANEPIDVTPINAHADRTYIPAVDQSPQPTTSSTSAHHAEV
jgi:hypothetical protein